MTTFRTSPMAEDLPSREALIRASSGISVWGPRTSLALAEPPG